MIMLPFLLPVLISQPTAIFFWHKKKPNLGESWAYKTKTCLWRIRSSSHYCNV